MNRKLFTLVYILILSLSVDVYALPTLPTDIIPPTTPGSGVAAPNTNPSTTKPPITQQKSTDAPPATKAEKSILDSILPNTKNCQYASLEKGKGGLYQPFSGIDDKFPGAKGILKMIKGKDGQTDCVNVGGGATESLVTLTFKTAILIIIVLTIISISISGIQYMTEEATGQIKGGARKRLTNSFIALGLGLLSYTILYTVNKQLVEFSFDPSSIDKDKSIQRGVSDAAAAFKNNSSILLGNVEIINPQAQTTPNSPYGTVPGSTPSWNEAGTMGNFSTYASYGSIKCGGNICSSSNPTVFGYLDGNGTVGRSGDNGVGNGAWSSIPGCTYDNGNTTSMGVALPQGFWRAAGISFADVKYIGIKVNINGVFARILPVVDDSESNLDFTFAAAKAYLDPTITSSNRINTAGKQVTFEIVKDYYKTNPKTGVVWIIDDANTTTGKPNYLRKDIRPCKTQ